MFTIDTHERPTWLSILLGLAFGAASVLVTGYLFASDIDGPVVILLVPGTIGLLAALVIRSGWGIVGLVIGIIVTAQIAASAGTSIIAAPDTTNLVLAVVSSLLGFATGTSITNRQFMPDFRPPAPADLARVEGDVRRQLRTIDPQAPGSFERATVLLRKVNEQTSQYGPWMGPRPAGEEIGPPTGLLDLQAELVETARIAALAAGARRVTITSSGMGNGIDVQAVFGDPIASDESLPSPASDVD